MTDAVFVSSGKISRNLQSRQIIFIIFAPETAPSPIFSCSENSPTIYPGTPVWNLELPLDSLWNHFKFKFIIRSCHGCLLNKFHTLLVLSRPRANASLEWVTSSYQGCYENLLPRVPASTKFPPIHPPHHSSCFFRKANPITYLSTQQSPSVALATEASMKYETRRKPISQDAWAGILSLLLILGESLVLYEPPFPYP